MRKTNLGFVEFVSYDNNIYFNDIFTGNIICLDLKEDVFKVLSRGGNSGKMQYGALMDVNGNLIFAPRNATNILVYNMKTGKKDSIKLDLTKVEGKPLFLGLVSCEEWLYFIPGRYSSIFVLNKKNFATAYIDIEKKNSDLFSTCNGWRMDDEICVITKNKNIVRIDCERKTKTARPFELNGFIPLVTLDYKEYQIFVGFGSKILVLNKEIVEIHWINSYKNCKEPIEGFSNLLCIDQNIYMIAMNQAKIYKLSLETREITSFVEFEWRMENRVIWNKFTKCDVIGAGVLKRSLLLYSTMRNAILEINVDTKEVRYHDYFHHEINNRNKYIQECIRNTDAVMEGEISLDEFLNVLKS